MGFPIDQSHTSQFNFIIEAMVYRRPIINGFVQYQDVCTPGIGKIINGLVKYQDVCIPGIGKILHSVSVNNGNILYWFVLLTIGINIEDAIGLFE